MSKDKGSGKDAEEKSVREIRDQNIQKTADAIWEVIARYTAMHGMTTNELFRVLSIVMGEYSKIGIEAERDALLGKK